MGIVIAAKAQSGHRPKDLEILGLLTTIVNHNSYTDWKGEGGLLNETQGET